MRTVWIVVLTALLAQPAAAQWGDTLNEAPLTPVPPQMTFEEYRDMNRRLSVGLALRAIPLPGMLHFYAGEQETGRRLVKTSLLGLASIAAGAFLIDEGDFPDTDFDVLVLNAGDKDGERRYEKIPVKVEGEVMHYRLRELRREGEGGIGVTFILLGVGVIAYDFLYDFVHGIKIIEEKRDRVRYKYGKQLGLQLSMRSARPTLQLSYAF